MIKHGYANDDGGYFKMKIKFSEKFTHEIDHGATNKWLNEPYEICYESFPMTLKLILDDGSFSLVFKLIYRLRWFLPPPDGERDWDPPNINLKTLHRNTNSFMMKIDSTDGTEFTGLKCDPVASNTGCRIGHDISSPENAYKICWLFLIVTSLSRTKTRQKCCNRTYFST